MPQEAKPLVIPEDHASAGPWGWYVLLAVGLCLSGFFPWLMVCWALFSRGRKRLALTALAVNAVPLALGIWGSLRGVLPWWWMLPLCHLANLLWSLGAWQFQRRTLGPAPRRYVASEWRGWLGPLLIGSTLGVCAAVTFSLPTVFGERAAMRIAGDTLDRQSALWGSLQHMGLGLVAGALLGLWWAGEGTKFRASHVIAFLGAFFVTVAGTGILALLILFILNRGSGLEGSFGAFEWALIPPWTGGFRRWLLMAENRDVSFLLITPLLFGAPSRIRDFARRALFVPLAFACTLPIAFAGSSWWLSLQGQIVHEMSSPDAGRRASAHGWCEILLRRFPDQARWPALAEQVARQHYEAGAHDEARALYQQIADRFGDSNEWYWVVANARGALASPGFGKPVGDPTLTIPLVDYESYLTRNWMALLSVIRYWEGAGVSESEVKIRLKGLSLSEDKILLNPLASLADLDDAAQSLGYAVFIVPADGARARALVSAGIPVLLPEHGSFNLVFGFDDSRSVTRAYSFGRVSERLRGEARREAKEILEMEEEGHGQSRDRLGRIRNEAYVELGPSRWQPATLAVRSPLMAVVCPRKRDAGVSRAMGVSLQDLRHESNGLLAALVGLAHLNHADPVQALEWAMTGSRRTSHPLPLHVGHLAQRLWESRHKSVKSRIPLQDALPQLRRLATFFESPEHAAFLQRARQRFEDDRAAGTLPWYIADRDISMLDPSDDQDLKLMIRAMRTRVRLEPSRLASWTSLADTCERAGDLPCTVEALAGASSASAMDSATKLRLAYAHVLQDEPAKTAQLLATIERAKVRYEADYRFCLGAVAEWKQNPAAAVREYEQAIAMRTYRAVYHLRLGTLLAKQGKKDGARQALEWAAKVDAEGRVAAEAARLIGTLGGAR